ncbi:MAG: hypothetical protein ACRDWY_16580 [Actinomycetes bacterium]
MTNFPDGVLLRPPVTFAATTSASPLERGRPLRPHASYFGFDPATATRYPDGTTIVRDADGFDVALHDASDPAPADGVSVVERDDEPDLVSFKSLDSDGWRIEIYWERS